MPVRALSPELAKKAREELNETESRIEGDIQHLKEWISKQPHLRARLDDQWLAAFLRGCKFSLEKTKEKIDIYYSLRSSDPDLFRLQYSSPKVAEIIDLGAMLVLPKSASPTDPRIVLMRPGRCDPDKYTMIELMTVMLLQLQIMQMEDDAMVICGVIYINDLQGVTLGHFGQMTPTLIKKIIAAAQDAAAIRLKGAHFLNTPVGFETLFNFIKSLLSEKNRSRMDVHNKDFGTLYKYVPKSVLPKEYGGDGGLMQDIIDHWKKKISEYSAWFEEDLKYGTDESKRITSTKTNGETFGIEGSFRQLTVD